ncbi:MAG: EVE domain-containing protein [Verrucomicrobia bacterium]|nr:EVE domain-containing protein [Verrucomicrobiota bacterium]
MNHWLVKQEPETYSWDDLVEDGRTAWTGVRNYQARNYLRAMAKGDPVLIYHSGGDKAVVGLARVSKAPFPDPTAQEGDWSAVELKAVKPLVQRVTLSQIKSDPDLADLLLVRHTRLSVMPVSAPSFSRILSLGGTRP